MHLSSTETALVRCLQDCATQAEHCAELASTVKGASQCASACRDAAALSRLGAELLARESAMAPWILPVSELAVAACADACEEHFGAFFADCARQCRALPRALDRVDRGMLGARERSRRRETTLTH